MQKERTIDALISGACGDAIKAETKFQNDLSLAIMTRTAMIDHFYMPGTRLALISYGLWQLTRRS